MITGTVNALHEIVIQVPVHDAAGREHEIETIFDSGFNGALTLPLSLILRLGLRWSSQVTSMLANGAVERFDVYAGALEWNGRIQQILVQAVDTAPLLGMALLVGHDLSARIVPGGLVRIESVSASS